MIQPRDSAKHLVASVAQIQPLLGFSRATSEIESGTQTPSQLLIADTPVQPHLFLRSANTDFVAQCGHRVFISTIS